MAALEKIRPDKNSMIYILTYADPS